MYLRAAAQSRGDYLGSMRGDPGLFGFIGKAFKGALGIAGGLGIPVISGAARTLRGLLPGGGPRGIQPVTQMYQSRQAGPGGLKIPGIRGLGQRIVPGGATGYYAKRRRMNPGNVKALRRAMRRQDSFVKLARRALKGSKYKITTVGSGSRRRPLHITESGPGGVTVGR